MKVVILAKEVPDTWGSRRLDEVTGWLDRASSEPVLDEINERTIEHLLKYRDNGGDVEIVALTMAPASSETSIRKLLAMGADSAVVVADEQLKGSDAVRTAQVLAAAIKKIAPDLVFAGKESTDGRGGIVPAMISEYLDWPVFVALDELQINDDSVSGSAAVDGEVLTLKSTFPAVVVITERSAEARFPNFKGIMQAKKKPFDVWSLSDIQIDQPQTAMSVMVSAAEKPPRTAGVKIEDDGTAAKQLADFLKSNRLV